MNPTHAAAIESEDMLARVDYADEYSAEVRTAELRTAVERFLFRTPAWVRGAMWVRDAIVRPFGLRTTSSEPATRPELREGERFGPFRMYRVTEDEVVAGDDDKHLSFRVQWTLGSRDVAAQKGMLKVKTEVEFHSGFGRVYFAPVKVGHAWVVKSMLRRAALAELAGE